jgi:Fe-S cluster assembly protein SufD
MTVLALKPVADADLFQEDFAANASRLPGAGQDWLDKKRAAALHAFRETGMPTRRVEAWKYTDLAQAIEGQLQPAERFDGPVRSTTPFAAIGGTDLLLVNGFLQDGDKPAAEDGIDIFDLAKVGPKTPDWVKNNFGLLAAGRGQPLGAASLALMRGGVALRVRSSNATVRLNFVNVAREFDQVSHGRVMIVVEANASLRLLESHTGEGTAQSLANLGMELKLQDGAKLEHIRLQAEAQNALHIASIGASLERNASYRALYAGLGGQISRVDVEVQLNGPGAQANLHSVAASNSGISDVTTVMDHAKPHTTSRQLFKSIVGGRGRSGESGTRRRAQRAP